MSKSKDSSFLKAGQLKADLSMDLIWKWPDDLSTVPLNHLPESLSPRCVGELWGSHERCQGPFRPSGRNRGLPLICRRGQGPHLAKRWEPRGFSRVAAGFSSYHGDLRLPLWLALGSANFLSSCEGKLGVALESEHYWLPKPTLTQTEFSLWDIGFIRATLIAESWNLH